MSEREAVTEASQRERIQRGRQYVAVRRAGLAREEAHIDAFEASLNGWKSRLDALAAKGGA